MIKDSLLPYARNKAHEFYQVFIAAKIKLGLAFSEKSEYLIKCYILIRFMGNQERKLEKYCFTD